MMQIKTAAAKILDGSSGPYLLPDTIIGGASGLCLSVQLNLIEQAKGAVRRLETWKSRQLPRNSILIQADDPNGWFSERLEHRFGEHYNIESEPIVIRY